MHDITPSPDQEEVLRLLDSRDWPAQCLFLTGEAGTGKSTLLQMFRERTEHKIVVLAPTGVAALNVGGQTIHSFFLFPPKPLNQGDDEIKRFRKGSPKQKIMAELDVLVIDEVSMVRADVMDAVDYCMRINTGRPRQPFGGKRLLVVGDLTQLEPVVREGADRVLIETTYESPFFFDALVFGETKLHTLNLTTTHRHIGDLRFLDALNEVRSGEPDAALETFNERYVPRAEAPDGTVYLTSTRAKAEQINLCRLVALPGNPRAYQGEKTGRFTVDDLPADAHLSLKVGAQVMFVRNGDDWVNGTIGTVTRLGHDWAAVDIPGTGEVEVGRERWESIAYTWDATTSRIQGEVVGAYSQIPLRLAWAMTIHKAQGLTFDSVVIDFGRGAFAHGQAYVALSRCRTLAGLTLATPLRRSDVILHPRIRNMPTATSLFD